MDESSNSDAAGRAGLALNEYQLGLAFFDKKQWKTAARHFRLADEKSARDDGRARLYRSCYGLSLVYSGDISGLNLCRNAAAREKREASVFLNLALAELKLHHRKRACDAITQGLRIAPRNAALVKLRGKIGMRRRPCLPFLARNNLLNKWLGKVTYRQTRRGTSR